MLRKNKKTEKFFDELCEDYYAKILKYLFAVLSDEGASRDCTQEVFLTAWQKREILMQHPNPGGFLFQTAKNLSKKAKREAFRRMIEDTSVEELTQEPVDSSSLIDIAIDKQIDESEYVEQVLGRLSQDKLELYRAYYVNRRSMEEIANSLGIKETALRMRYVRLRREIQEIAKKIALECFIS